LPNSDSWQRFRTDHFELTTDLPNKPAVEAALALERTRTALLLAVWSRMETSRQTERVRVVVLADGSDFERYFGKRVEGVHIQVGRELIALKRGPEHWERRYLGGEYVTSVLRHEIAHHLAAGIYGRQPRWFAEGLAQYLEAVVIEPTGERAWVGRPNPAAFGEFRRFWSIGVKDALAWSQFDPRETASRVGGLYGISWMMVQWMRNEQPELFVAYQTALVRGLDPERAWADTFGSPGFENLDEQLDNYTKSGRFRVDEINLSTPPVLPVPVSITPADVHALRAQLAIVGHRTDPRRQELEEEAKQELLTALALEPGHAAALSLWRSFGRLPNEELVQRLRDQVRRRPDDGEAWLFMASLLDADECEAALRQAVALLAGQARAYNELAWYLVQSGRAEEALPMATKAAYLAPRDPEVLDTYAASLFSVGRCPDALRVQLRAIDNLPENVSRNPGWTSHFTVVLARYRAACGASGAPQ
jgi:tetratricopeptide (TPR) repeat protein